MASRSHRMPADPHIVGRIEESRIDPRPVTNDPLQKSGIAAVATSDPMLAENPDIAWLRPWRYREGRDHLIIGIGGRREDHVDLAGREAGQRGIDIDIDRSEFAQFQLQDFDIPAGIESDLVVGNPERPLLDLGEAGQGDGRDLSKPHRPGSLKPAMARDDMALGISEYRIGEAERFNGRADLIDLALRMGTGIARIRNEVADRAVSNGQPRRQASKCWFVHGRGLM